jgi:RimJ/RimL family protein N-acetyltransferase
MARQLIEIGEDGQPALKVALSETAVAACGATAAMYERTGFLRPWIGYLVQQDDELVGTCAFKTRPQTGQVELAYYTFAGHEGKGLATWMARQLVRIAQDADRHVMITAQTLPEENASTTILRKIGFSRTGTAHDADAGEVWQWQLQSATGNGSNDKEGH